MFFGSLNKFTPKDEDDIELMIDTIEAFIDGKTNSISFEDNEDIKFVKIQKRLELLGEKLIDTTKGTLSVEGEMMLLLEKVSDGYRLLFLSCQQQTHFLATTHLQLFFRYRTSQQSSYRYHYHQRFV